MTDLSITSLVDEHASARARLELEKLQIEIDAAKIDLAKKRVDLERVQREEVAANLSEIFELAKDDEAHGVYYFTGAVTMASVRAARAAIFGWMRLDAEPAEGEERTIDFNSGGGSVYAGDDLFGVIRAASAHGFHMKTIISGFAGSMAGMLVQAGDERLIRRGSHLHLHEASSWSVGKGSELLDDARFTDRLSWQCAHVYAERSNLTAREIFDRMERREWYLDADEALDVGFVDGII